MATGGNLGALMAALDASQERMRETSAGGTILVTHAAAIRMVGVWTLAPAPRDPVRHLDAAHVRAREYLARLAAHDPAREVASVMTKELFRRLTDAHPAPLTSPPGVGRYTYTPRKVLRRVLDHALDHLNQIHQWLVWRSDGIVPTATDGWVPSTVTLPDDRLPLTQPDLDAWLWRIDQAARLLTQRAAQLSTDEVDWLPPNGGWPLRRVLHHVARSELLYATSLDESLPIDDPVMRYTEACQRLDERVREAEDRGDDPDVVYAGLYGVLGTPQELIADVLGIEAELLAGAA
jgi:DinB family protein